MLRHLSPVVMGGGCLIFSQRDARFTGAAGPPPVPRQGHLPRGRLNKLHKFHHGHISGALVLTIIFIEQRLQILLNIRQYFWERHLGWHFIDVNFLEKIDISKQLKKSPTKPKM